MSQQRSIQELVKPDLSQASLPFVLMQLRITTYLHNRFEQLYDVASRIGLFKTRSKTVQQLLGKVTDLTEANQMTVVGGYVGSINRGQQAYFLEKSQFGNL